jgi:hypothetical protein
MFERHRCRVCETGVADRPISVLRPGHRFEDWFICDICRCLSEVDLRRTTPDSAPEPSLDGPAVRLTEPQFRSLIDVALQADGDIPVRPEARRRLERRILVRGELREIDANLKDAMAASALGDWAGTLEAVRLIHGRAVVTRRVLEGILGTYPVAADLPPLVRAVQVVGRLISEREVDSLAPDELRARMHAVLRALDHELEAFLEPPEEAPISADRDRDAPPGGPSAPARQ